MVYIYCFINFPVNGNMLFTNYHAVSLFVRLAQYLAHTFIIGNARVPDIGKSGSLVCNLCF